MLALVPTRRATLDGLLAARAPRDIAEVIALMRSIEAALPRGDGVAWFTRLYRAVTEGVAEALTAGTFRSPEFVRSLDVAFANLFFVALRRHAEDPDTVPKAWAPLIEARRRCGIVPLQFALAGMNAHINGDLPVALVATWRALRIEPQRRSREHRDFRRVNALLAETEERVKLEFVTGALAEVDASLGAVDDVLAMWNVRKAREAAWANAETLWAIRGIPALRSHFLVTLDRMVGFAGRGLLRPLVPRVST